MVYLKLKNNLCIFFTQVHHLYRLMDQAVILTSMILSCSFLWQHLNTFLVILLEPSWGLIFDLSANISIHVLFPPSALKQINFYKKELNIKLPSALDRFESPGVGQGPVCESSGGKGGTRARDAAVERAWAHGAAAEGAARRARAQAGAQRLSRRTHAAARLAEPVAARGTSALLAAAVQPSLAAVLSAAVRSAIVTAAIVATSIARGPLYITLFCSSTCLTIVDKYVINNALQWMLSQLAPK